MNVQRLMLSRAHVSNTIAKEDEPCCLLSDETSKYGQKFEGFHLSDSHGKTWVLGLRHLVTKSGRDTLQTLQEILADIDSVGKNSDNLGSQQILLNIVSTMSDRAATQMKFNSLLEEYKTNILKEELRDKWEEMSDVEKLSISKLNNFSCGLHVLVHIAEAASSCLIEAEKVFFYTNIPIYDSSFRKSGESGCLRLIRTTSKAFSCGGDEKNGAYSSFNVYIKPFLREKHVKRAYSEVPW